MILLYHHVAPAGATPSISRQGPADGWQFLVTPERLRYHLLTLRGRGYSFVSLSELIGEIRATGVEPADAVAVTFDDGWIDQHTFAFPILRELGCPATFFVTTGHLAENRRDPARMTPGQLRELASNGMTVGGHTRSHPDLRRLPDDRIVAELVGCRQDLEAVLDGPVRYFAYPGGAFDARVAGLVRAVGFDAACSVLGPHVNGSSSLFWLFRDTLTERLDSLADAYRLSPSVRRLLGFRVRRRLRRALAGPSSEGTVDRTLDR